MSEQRSCPTCLWSNEAFREGIESHCGTCLSSSTDGTMMTGWNQSPAMVHSAEHPAMKDGVNNGTK